jgi:hypothetical protein
MIRVLPFPTVHLAHTGVTVSVTVTKFVTVIGPGALLLVLKHGTTVRLVHILILVVFLARVVATGAGAGAGGGAGAGAGAG